MKSYCINCMKETLIDIVRTIDNKCKTEKKIKGYCKVCNNTICKVVAIKK